MHPPRPVHNDKTKHGWTSRCHSTPSRHRCGGDNNNGDRRTRDIRRLTIAMKDDCTQASIYISHISSGSSNKGNIVCSDGRWLLDGQGSSRSR